MNSAAAAASKDIATNDAEQNGQYTEQYLTFMLAGEEYGIKILNVQEIKGWSGVTPIPNTPPHILGILNLRGTVVPIIDLRTCFGLEPSEFGPTTVVIMAKSVQEDGEKVVGIVVDAVSEVYNVPVREIEPPPAMGMLVSTEFIKGLATVEGKMVILLNIAHLVETEIAKANLDG